MAGTIRGTLLASAVALAFAQSAHAYGWSRSWGAPAVAYRTSCYPVVYYPACWTPAYYVTAIPVAPYPPPPLAVTPLAPLAPLTPFAQPRPAPPSPSTGEPPLSKPEQRAPKVLESRHSGELRAGIDKVETNGRLKVGFWNITGRDVTLTIEGKTHALPRNRALTLELDHQFTWKLDRAAARSEDLPATQDRYEIVLRPE